jgi:phosphosulfolactate synthase (CoM biosynthesis protein A)
MAQAIFTQIMLRHAAVLLSRLTQELKVLKELRDYALMLLQEAEQMFVADVDSGRPAADSIKRLRDTVDCGRQLFAQRASMEGTEAAGVFDEQVSIVINAQASPFAEALAAATRDSKRAAS